MLVSNSSSSTVNVKMASDGVWQGENPLDFALPLLAVQIAVILAVTQGIALALRPLRQPKVVAEILVSSSFISFLYICVMLFWRTGERKIHH